ncbi:hypothetical protein TWF192_011117 [Orbilia oligospora]|uniref:Uncharacterized protein n=1 Tax=Orbilia oligospora TaxID=2813651 RepID=A0A6G1MK29_ORBOL|nr:hypothetical protein TWF191_003554 [Orbilia oligospora]KAF3258984.1 hypothetical protein TWF192_011117 [Orbilia oligospora]
MSSFNIGALRVVLLETPGITNSYIPSVLPEVEEFLAKSFPGKSLSGIIYTQRIDNEFQKPSLAPRTIEAVKSLLPGGILDHSKVCLVTNCWGSPGTGSGLVREQKNTGRESAWKELCDSGAKYCRLKYFYMPIEQRTAESAVYEIVEWALGRISNITLQSFESDKEGRPKDPSPKGDVDFPQVSCLVPSIGAGDKPTIGSGIVKWQAEPELGAKALMKAVECNYPQTTKLLLEAGTNPKSTEPGTSTTALHLAASLGRERIIKYLLKYINGKEEVNKSDGNGDTPLHRACANGHYKCVKLLLKGGANVELADGMGTLPLHHALMKRDWKIAGKLIRAGAKIDGEDLEALQLNRDVLLDLTKSKALDRKHRFLDKVLGCLGERVRGDSQQKKKPALS